MKSFLKKLLCLVILFVVVLSIAFVISEVITGFSTKLFSRFSSLQLEFKSPNNSRVTLENFSQRLAEVEKKLAEMETGLWEAKHIAKEARADARAASGQAQEAYEAKSKY